MRDSLVVEVDIAAVEYRASLRAEKNTDRPKNMTGVDEFDRDVIALTSPHTFARQSKRLAQWTGLPSICRSIGFAMREERVNRDADFLTLPGHDTDRIVQKRAADFRGPFGHENARLGLAPHQDRQCPDVVKVRMRNDNAIERTVTERRKIRQRIFAFLLRMHSAVEDEPLAGRLEIIAICANLGAAREINELQR